MISINKAWRILVTGVCFIFFSFCASILGYIYFPIINKLNKDKEKVAEKSQYAIHLGFKLFIAILHYSRCINFRFEGIDKLLEDEGCLFVANHPTLIDYVAIISKLPRCDNIVKQDLWENPYFKNVIQSAGYIPNINPDQTLARLKEIFSEGRNLLIFPEGTRTTPNHPILLKRGAAVISLRTGASIRMIHMDCVPITLTKNTKWFNIPNRMPTISVVVGDKIDPQKFLDDANNLPSIASRRLTKHIQEHMSKKL